MKSSEIEKISNIWVKWEPILLYLLFTIQFNFEAYFWDGFTSNYVVLVASSFIPLYFHLTLYIRILPEIKFFYRVFSFLSNIIFFGITFIMNFPYSIFLFYTIIMLLFSLLISLIILERKLPYFRTLDIGFGKSSLLIVLLMGTVISWLLFNLLPFPEEIKLLLPRDIGLLISLIPGMFMLLLIQRRIGLFFKIKANMSDEDISRILNKSGEAN